MTKYTIWFDLLLEDHFAVKNDLLTIALKDRLKYEKIITHEVIANSEIEAINMIYPKENRKINNPIFH